MSSSFSFPDWMPWWAQLLLILAGILITLAFVVMPFSVFGVKSRLDAIEARLDEIQGEIRALALRLPEPGRRAAFEEPGRRAAFEEPVRRAAFEEPGRRAAFDEAGRRGAGEEVNRRAAGPVVEDPNAGRPALPDRTADRLTEARRPPIPPASWSPEAVPRRPIGAGVLPPVIRREPGLPGGRTEPRIDRSR